ncbi:unnamed protein product [Enterobius vermicularis]|uniref:Movement protein n=1 Tax=Enterobius vermicularis TaxID=51028 RepID=A0A0N4UUM8_ENTVE|nr:unnamed protein product [Enterobius vermicularis]
MSTQNTRSRRYSFPAVFVPHGPVSRQSLLPLARPIQARSHSSHVGRSSSKPAQKFLHPEIPYRGERHFSFNSSQTMFGQCSNLLQPHPASLTQLRSLSRTSSFLNIFNESSGNGTYRRRRTCSVSSNALRELKVKFFGT